jgi:DNA-binding CsgD family transcriptional regulator
MKVIFKPNPRRGIMNGIISYLVNVAGLTHREAEVAEATTKGFTNRESAQLLFVTEKTIKFHLTNIYRKMNVTSRSQLIVKVLAATAEYRTSEVAATPTPIAPTTSGETTLPVGQ